MVKLMIKKDNYRISKKIHHRLSYTTIAALFSVILILSAGGIGLPLLQQQQQQEAYASSQVQGPLSAPSSPPPSSTHAVPPQSSSQALSTPSSIQAPPLPPPTPICDPQ